MLRTIVQPADLSTAALADFKNWLGISRSGEDALLLDLLGASAAMCEAFTGQTPLEQTIEERLPAKAGQYCLTARPVKILADAELVAADGTRTSLSGQGHGFTVDPSNVAVAQIKSGLDGQSIAVRLIVGIASDWETLPRPLKQGIIRMAAYYYRDRDRENDTQPPASVTALWRPWRTLRLT